MCQQNVQASPGCRDIQARFFKAQVQCVNGYTEAPACDSLALLTGANGCSRAVNDTSCYGTECRFDSDCGDLQRFTCNTALNTCVAK